MEDNKMKRTFALILISVLLCSTLAFVACNPGDRDIGGVGRRQD